MKNFLTQTWQWILKESVLEFSYKYSGNSQQGEREFNGEIGWLWIFVLITLFI